MWRDSWEAAEVAAQPQGQCGGRAALARLPSPSVGWSLTAALRECRARACLSPTPPLNHPAHPFFHLAHTPHSLSSKWCQNSMHDSQASRPRSESGALLIPTLQMRKPRSPGLSPLFSIKP